MTQIDVVAGPAELGECPLWSPAESVLYWIDIDGRSIHRFDPVTGEDAERPTPGRPGCLALTSEPGHLLLASEGELLWLDWVGSGLEPFVRLEDEATGNRLNDGRTDPAGRLVVGTMWPETGDAKTTGSLYQVEADGSFSVLRRDVGVPNGIAFDPINGRTYFADSPRQLVWVWDYDPDTATRSNERVFLDYRDLPGAPDGGCVDADGCYWSASVHGWAVIRVTPEGNVDRRIEVPAEMPSMPAFGGEDLSTLYVTTINPSRPGPATEADGPASGSLLAIDPGVQGLVDPVFAGR